MLHAFFFFSSRRRHTRLQGDWSSDVCSSDLGAAARVDLDGVYGRRALAAYAAAALASLLLFAGVIMWGPRGVAEGVAHLVAPSGMAAATDTRAVKVKPGAARVPKGSDQEITAALQGFDSETAAFFSRPVGADDSAWQGQGMEQAKARAA